LHRFEDNSNNMQASICRERLEQTGKIYRHVDGRYNEIEAAGDLLENAIVPRVMDVMGAQLAGLLFLAIARGESVDFATPFVGELQGHVAQAADTDYPDACVEGMLY
jgi:hypothetical protein